MLVRRTVGARGQVVLPKDIRQQFGIGEGTEITFESKDSEIVIKPAKTPEQAVEEFCRTSRKVKMGDGAKWVKKAIEEQLEERYGLR
ncbi:AbrB/MazE/SpoVT family DNA-binding domain-containing protein [Candidatus Woesearchaeota archaeon]|nr:AbrB/MazE/SpoVT family DNA-binding domain-containing protein [Candidatus Woesearchaeota archaeon]